MTIKLQIVARLLNEYILIIVIQHLQHIMVMKIETQCYLMKLDDAKAMKVHDAASIVEIEVHIILHSRWITPTPTPLLDSNYMYTIN